MRDGPSIGRIAAKTYFNIALTAWVAPHREKYYTQYERGYIERAIVRLLSPRAETFVACTAEGEVVGEVQFKRLGDDAGARKLINDAGMVRRLFVWVASWVFWVYFKVVSWAAGGDKSRDPEALRILRGWIQVDEERIWKSHEERANRWHVQSLVVLPEWQKRGIGKRLMMEVMSRAKKDGVMIGLESSIIGEGMYKKLGFELLGRYTQEPNLLGLEHGDEGGLMAWYPEGWKKDAEVEL